MNRHRRARMTVAGLVLLAIGGYAAVNHHQTGGGRTPRCTVLSANGGTVYEMEPEQASNAATIGAVASARQLPERAVTIALATAMQESTLRNIDHGDRDSLGLFQQRPSQGWGTAEEIMDPVFAAGKFYDRLVEIPGYTELPLTDAAQEVQRSGFPLAYAKHEPDAAVLAAALTGRESAALTCTWGNQERAAGHPAQIRERLAREFGAVVPAHEPDEAGGAGKNASHNAPRSVITIPVRSADRGDSGRGEPADDAVAIQRGWELAHWSVAHAAELGIEQITYRDRVWSAAKSGDGWRRTEAEPSSDVRLTTAQ